MVLCHVHNFLSLEQWLNILQKNICRDNNELVVLKQTNNYNKIMRVPSLDVKDLGYHFQPPNSNHSQSQGLCGQRQRVNLILYYWCIYFKVSPCSPDWIQTHNPPALASLTLESQMCPTTPGSPCTHHTAHILYNTHSHTRQHAHHMPYTHTHTLYYTIHIQCTHASTHCIQTPYTYHTNHKALTDTTHTHTHVDTHL